MEIGRLKMKIYLIPVFIMIMMYTITCTSDSHQESKFGGFPEHGFLTHLKASKWEESLLTGNGTIGALVPGDPLKERIVLSHEKLFMPEFPPKEAPDLGSHLDEIRELVLSGREAEAAELAVELGVEAGIEDLVWTDPAIPACQLEIEALTEDSLFNYYRKVDYESGIAETGWETSEGRFQRSVFVSRPANISVMKIHSPDNIKQNWKLRLAQLPVEASQKNSELEDDFASHELIEDAYASSFRDGTLTYFTQFQKKWEGSLKGYFVETKVIPKKGTQSVENGWFVVKDADEILVLSTIKLSYELPVNKSTSIENYTGSSYDELLTGHAKVQKEMFNRFSFNLSNGDKENMLAEDLIKTSSPGSLDNDLLVQLMEASRYILISSTGEIPPTLQGIWGGTWRPAWSGDFTLNGNVPSVIASGLNTNFQEVTEAYLDYMWSMFGDFKDNARDLYGSTGIFVPSRSSAHGKTYHYIAEFPHLFWYAGNSWTSQIFYDYWLYTGDEEFLNQRTIPFMLESAKFYEFIITKDDNGQYMFVPSYSPEVGPTGKHPVAINATMDVAGLKQLMRNLLSLTEEGYIENPNTEKWKDILNNLPDYAIDEKGELKEWIWPGYDNNNEHRHASHLYPLFYEVDPAFENNPELREAAIEAIDARMEYRRKNEGAEMAFGLVQKGLAAAHLDNAELAYECVDWLCNSYWSPAFTSYHDPHEIFNVDITGGLPAVVTEMIVQSAPDEIKLLPAIPAEWPDGEINGALTRCGVTVDVSWKEGKLKQVNLKADRDTKFDLVYGDKTESVEISNGKSYSTEMK